MLARPLSSPAQLSEQTELSPATIGSVLLRLEKLDIVKEISGQQRNRLYSYISYIALMNQGTELPT